METYLDLFEDQDELVPGTKARVLKYSFDLWARRFRWMLMMMRRVTDLVRTWIRGVCQWR